MMNTPHHRMSDTQRDALVADYVRYRAFTRERITDFKSAFNIFLSYITRRGIDVLSLSAQDAQDFRDYLTTKTHENGTLYYRPSSVAHIVSRVSVLYEYMRRRKYVPANPFKAALRARRKRTFPRHILSSEHTELIDGLIAWLTVKGYKPRGFKEKRYAAQQLCRYAEEHGITLAAMSVRQAEAFREELRRAQDEKGAVRYDPATINGKLASAHLFFRFLVETGRAAHNPWSGVERMKERVRLPQNILTVGEMKTLLEGIEVKDASDVKFKTIVELLYATGARVGEIENLTRDDIDLESGYILIRDDKERQDRRCPLTETARELLTLYLAHISTPPGEKVFAQGKTRTLNTWLNDRLKRLSEKLEQSRITCHGLRHTIATHLIKEGADIREVQEYLGHRRIKNTEVYTRLFPDDLKEAIERSHPRERRYAEERHEAFLDDTDDTL